jgi:uncharacterized surface protein with fasciclin (FAS1) repeats
MYHVYIGATHVALIISIKYTLIMQYLKLFALSLVIFAGASLQSAHADTIVDVAVDNGNFKTLVSLVTKAELVDALSGEDALTVFAPTDAAFAKLSPYVTNLLVSNPELLKEVLLYHVVAGENRAADVVKERSLTTLSGSDVHVRTVRGNVFLNQAKVVTPDVEASNGVIHVVDGVLIPNTVYKAILDSLRADLKKIIEKRSMKTWK